MPHDPAPADDSSARARRRWAIGAAALVGALSFVFRILSDRGLSNDHYMHMAWAQQVLLGDLPGRDFVDPGMPLAYVLSALVQVLSPGPFSEVVLSSAMLAVAAAATCLVVTRMTASLGWGVGAALLVIGLQPRYYSYPKILVPAVTLLVLQWYAASRVRSRVVALAAWSVAAGLLRYDLGLYTAAAVVAGLVALEGGATRRAAVSVAAYVAALAAVALPYLLFVQLTEGIPTHVRGSIEFGRSDQHQFGLALPAFPFSMLTSNPASWSTVDAATLVAHVTRALALMAPIVAFAVWRGLAPAARASAAAGIAFLWSYLVVVLRAPYESRIQDLAGLIAIVGAWTAAEIVRAGLRRAAGDRGVRRLATATAAALAVATIAVVAVSVWMLGSMRTQLRESGITGGLPRMRQVLANRVEEGRSWPWQAYWPAGPVPEAIRYVRECTAQTDRFLVTWAAAEYYYYAGRGFAAGHSQLLAPRSFTAESDQRLMLSRFQRHRVPVVFINETGRAELARTYPLLEAFLREHYTVVGTFAIRNDEESVSVAVKNGMTGTSTFGPGRWPCGFFPDRPAGPST